MANTHEIIVSNIGTVYSGDDYKAAMDKWHAYVMETRETNCRVSGETVTWLENGEIRCEANGSLYTLDKVNRPAI